MIKELSEKESQASRKAHTADITAALMRAARRAHLIAYQKGTGVVIMRDDEVVEIEPDPEMFEGLIRQYKSPGVSSQIKLNKRNVFTRIVVMFKKRNRRRHLQSEEKFEQALHRHLQRIEELEQARHRQLQRIEELEQGLHRNLQSNHEELKA